MPADRILECPFCGGTPYVATPDVHEHGIQPLRVRCSQCFVDVDARTREQAIELWNRRTGTVYNGKTAEEWYRCIESISSFLTQCETKAAKDMQIAVETLDGEGYSDALGKQEAFSSIMLMISDVLAPSPAKP